MDDINEVEEELDILKAMLTEAKRCNEDRLIKILEGRIFVLEKELHRKK